jgi:streptomycin 6-kinase
VNDSGANVGAVEERLASHARAWGVAVAETLETPSSLVAFGTRGPLPVVLKVVRRPCDEWHSGAVLEAFGGRGTVRALKHAGGAVLLERLDPGTPLANVSLAGRDDEATEIIAGVIGRMSPLPTPAGAFATVGDWGEGFELYLSGGDRQIPRDLVERAQRAYLDLCASQKKVRLLHGDLQHYNVLFDAARGWVAIDPKGVVGEIEYEIGASLRNPYEGRELFASPAAVERRIRLYEAALGLDAERALRWAFAQGVLSVLWSVEDGGALDAHNTGLLLAAATLPLLETAPGTFRPGAGS